MQVVLAEAGCILNKTDMLKDHVDSNIRRAQRVQHAVQAQS